MEETYMEQDTPAAADPAQIYLDAATLAQGLTSQELKQAVALFESIPDYLDAKQRAAAVRNQYIELLHKEQAEVQAQKAAKLKQYLIYGGCIVAAAAVLITVVVLVVSAIRKSNTYSDALTLMEQENYHEAIELFTQLEDYRDAPGMLEQAQNLRELQLKDAAYADALKLVEAKDYEAAIDAFEQLSNHKDSPQQLETAKELLRLQQEEQKRAETYAAALELLESGEDEKENEAYGLLTELGDYKDVPQLLEKFQLVATQDSFDAKSGSYCDTESVSTFDDKGLVTFISREVELSYNKSYTTEITYTYDDAGRELTASYEYLNILSSQMGDKNPTKVMSFYDDDGRLIERRTVYLDQTVGHEYTRWYDEDENLLSTKLSDEYLLSTRLNDEYLQSQGSYTMTCKVINAEGKVVRTWEETVNNDGTLSGERSYEKTYEYNEDGLLTHTTTNTSPTTSYITSYAYNTKGQLISMSTSTNYTRYSYDDNGNLLTLTYGVNSRDQYTITYTYSWVYAPNAK